jgi:hypothetical protein
MLALMLMLYGPVPSASPALLEPANAPIAAFVEARDMLAARRFADLTALLERLRNSSEIPENADALRWRLAAFELQDAKTSELLDEWIKAQPKSLVPLLARAAHRSQLATDARGAKFASETSPEQFRGMAEALVGLALAETLSPTDKHVTWWRTYIAAHEQQLKERRPLLESGARIVPSPHP